ncbi:MAG: hypothetical protein JXR70_09010 [Spirochaetales bacterium]|nr:hypothetical protein [Spirochaetales bacterium]
MGRNQYNFEKRQREINKKKKKEAKRLKKANADDSAENQRLINEYLQQPIPEEETKTDSAESSDSSEQRLAAEDAE